MSRIPTDLLYGLSVALVGVLAVVFPPILALAAGLVLGAGLYLLRIRRDKNAAALRTARRPLIEALWAHSGEDGELDRLTGAVGRLLRDEAIADAVVLVGYEAALDRLGGYLSHAGGVAPVCVTGRAAEGLMGQSLRSGRPLTTDVAGVRVETELAAGVTDEHGWVALPLLDPAPLAACLDGGTCIPPGARGGRRGARPPARTGVAPARAACTTPCAASSACI